MTGRPGHVTKFTQVLCEGVTGLSPRPRRVVVGVTCHRQPPDNCHRGQVVCHSCLKTTTQATSLRLPFTLASCCHTRAARSDTSRTTTPCRRSAPVFGRLDNRNAATPAARPPLGSAPSARTSASGCVVMGSSAAVSQGNGAVREGEQHPQTRPRLRVPRHDGVRKQREHVAAVAQWQQSGIHQVVC